MKTLLLLWVPWTTWRRKHVFITAGWLQLKNRAHYKIIRRSTYTTYIKKQGNHANSTKKSNQNSSSTITPTSFKPKTQIGNTSKSATTSNLNKKGPNSPNDPAKIIEQQQQMIGKLLQRVKTLEGKLSEIQERILVTQTGQKSLGKFDRPSRTIF